ncbi:MAG: HEAT repeat domain-containing protein [Candidatus Diapherotrites archaeon]
MPYIPNRKAIRRQLERLRAKGIKQSTERKEILRERIKQAWKERYGDLEKYFEREGIDPSSKLAQNIKRLKDQEPNVRKNAAWELGEIKDKRATPYLIKGLEDTDPGVRGVAAWAIKQILVNENQALKKINQQLERELPNQEKKQAILLLYFSRQGRLPTEKEIHQYTKKAKRSTIKRIMRMLGIN